MSVGTWHSESGRFSSGPVQAVPVRQTLAASLRTRRRTAPTAESWILLLAGVAVGLATYTLLQVTALTAARPEQPELPSPVDRMLVSSDPAPVNPAIAPLEAERLEPLAASSRSEREVPAPPALRSTLGASNLRTSTLYDRAAARYGLHPAILRALHAVESTTSSGGCIANRQGSGAIGPFQFKPATFRQYAVDADGDGRTDACAFADSLFSAARYLKALGANADIGSSHTYRALRRYGTPADRVVALAAGAVR
jgi:hypothetical protein